MPLHSPLLSNIIIVTVGQSDLSDKKHDQSGARTATSQFSPFKQKSTNRKNQNSDQSGFSFINVGELETYMATTHMFLSKAKLDHSET